MSEGELAGQTVVLIGGSAGIGLGTARCARGEALSPRVPAGIRGVDRDTPGQLVRVACRVVAVA